MAPDTDFEGLTEEEHAELQESSAQHAGEDASSWASRAAREAQEWIHEERQQHQDQRSIDNVSTDAQKRLPLRQAAGVRVGHGNADHEHECRLNQVPQGTAGPLHMIELVAEKLPHG